MEGVHDYGYDELDMYYRILGEEFMEYVEKALIRYHALTPTSLVVLLSFLIQKRGLDLSGLVKHIDPIVKHHPQPEIRGRALALMVNMYKGLPQELKPFLIIGLKDTAPVVRWSAEKVMISQSVDGLEPIVKKNLKRLRREKGVYQYKFLESLERHTTYLGKNSYPIIKTILENKADDSGLINSHLKNIKNEIPDSSWNHFTHELIALFSQYAHHANRGLVLEIMGGLMHSDELKPFLKVALDDSLKRTRTLAGSLANEKGISGLEEIIINNIQDTSYYAVSDGFHYVEWDGELLHYFEYVGPKLLNSLVLIWQDHPPSNSLMGKYLYAIRPFKDEMDFKPLHNILRPFFYGKSGRDREYVTGYYLKSIKAPAEKMKAIDKALQDRSYQVRRTALNFAVDHSIEGLNKTFIQYNLLNPDDNLLRIMRRAGPGRKPKKNEITLSLHYLGDEAIPTLKEVLATIDSREMVRLYLRSMLDNFDRLSLSSMRNIAESLDPVVASQLNSELTTLNCLIYLQNDSIDQLKQLLIEHKRLLPAVERFAYTVPVIRLTEDARNHLIQTHTNDPNYIKELTTHYGELASEYLFLGAFSNAVDAAKVGLELGSDEASINSSFALGLLYQGQYDAARGIYQKYRDQLDGAGQRLTERFLIDLKKLEDAGLVHPDGEKVKALLNE